MFLEISLKAKYRCFAEGITCAEHKMSESKAREPINTGVAWIDCALEQLPEAA
ncbi:hypothetical protein PVLB_18820 [Pseudomonas sp. VLB120]|nr:hypothetical protein PVLB_18820 [Pseudomonas sp. VLB120]